MNKQQPEQAVGKLGLAVTLYSLRENCQTVKAIAETLRKVKKIGYDHVQLSALGPIEPEELRKTLDGEGLGACASHVGLPRLQNELSAIIDEHHIWGCKHTAIGALPAAQRDAQGYAEFAKQGSEMAAKLAEAGISFSYHNHFWEFDECDGRLGIDILYEDSDPKLFLAEIDTCWAAYAGHDPAELISKMSGRQILVHFKDMILPSQDTQGTLPVGEGSLDWPGIVEACQQANIQWVIVEQDYCQGDPFECIGRSYEYLKGLGL
ncbi:MAG: sugar phosphate isomerase/epimerase [Planctomycetota bacterium]|jgi:sugar phosphate isomerase/epimerase|nr:sugar phosphate isomerase/epimerase [Planctomycetota bacterium]